MNPILQGILGRMPTIQPPMNQMNQFPGLGGMPMPPRANTAMLPTNPGDLMSMATVGGQQPPAVPPLPTPTPTATTPAPLNLEGLTGGQATIAQLFPRIWAKAHPPDNSGQIMRDFLSQHPGLKKRIGELPPLPTTPTPPKPPTTTNPTGGQNPFPAQIPAGLDYNTLRNLLLQQDQRAY